MNPNAAFFAGQRGAAHPGQHGPFPPGGVNGPSPNIPEILYSRQKGQQEFEQGIGALRSSLISDPQLAAAVKSFVPPASHFEPYTSYVPVVCGVFALTDIFLVKTTTTATMTTAAAATSSPPVSAAPTAAEAPLPWDVMGYVVGLLFTARCVRPGEEWFRIPTVENLPYPQGMAYPRQTHYSFLHSRLTLDEWTALWFLPPPSSDSDDQKHPQRRRQHKPWGRHVVNAEHLATLSQELFPSLTQDVAIKLTRQVLENRQGKAEHGLVRVRLAPQAAWSGRGDEPIRILPRGMKEDEDGDRACSTNPLNFPLINQCRFVVDLSEIDLTAQDLDFASPALQLCSEFGVRGLVLEASCLGDTVPDGFLRGYPALRCLIVKNHRHRQQHRYRRPLTALGNEFLAMCGTLDAIDLAFLRDVTQIGTYFLSQCTSLYEVCLAPLSHLREVPEGFLQDCTSLERISLRGLENVTRIHSSSNAGFSLLGPYGSGSFLAGCTALRAVDLSPLQNVQQIGGGFLANCVSLQELNLSGLCGVQRIGPGFLMGCRGLKRLCLTPLRSIYSIPSGLLQGCTQLETVDFEGLDKVVKIGMCFLAGCHRLGKMIDNSSNTNNNNYGIVRKKSGSCPGNVLDLTPLRQVRSVESHNMLSPEAMISSTERARPDPIQVRVTADCVALILSLIHI